MKARALVGKTIARVVQSTDSGWGSGRATSIDAIQFTDGTWLRFLVLEHADGGEYGIEPIYPAREA